MSSIKIIVPSKIVRITLLFELRSIVFHLCPAVKLRQWRNMRAAGWLSCSSGLLFPRLHVKSKDCTKRP